MYFIEEISNQGFVGVNLPAGLSGNLGNEAESSRVGPVALLFVSFHGCNNF